MTSSHSFVEQRISEPADHPKKFAGLLGVLLVAQFTRGMVGLECFVNGVQGINRAADHHVVHQRVACGGRESPVQFGCYVCVFSSAYFLLK